MALLAWIVLSIVVLVAVVSFMQRFYRKSTRDIALLRTGAGGQRVALDGGFFALPMLHSVGEINMRAHRVMINRTGTQSLLTEDRLRVDVAMEFRVRVNPEPADVATAAQTFGARTLRSEELGHMLEGRFADVIQSCAATRTLDTLHERRAEFVGAVRAELASELKANGLILESVALTSFDQTPFAALDENNVFNAVGMRKLAEIVATNKKRRAETEADAEMAVAQTLLLTSKRRIELEMEREHAEIGQRQEIESARIRSDADVAKAKEQANLTIERARLDRERQVVASQIDRDNELDKARLQAQLTLEMQRVSQSIELSRQQELEAAASIDGERASTQLALEQEAGLTEREKAIQQRRHDLAVARRNQDDETETLRVKSELSSLLQRAQAEADAALLRIKSQEISQAADAAAMAAKIAAENSQSHELMQQRLELARLEMLPNLTEKMVKPLEKIESIKINHISGMGGNAGSSNKSGTPLDAIYDMAVNLPMLKKLGESLGADLDLTVPQIARAEADHARAMLEQQKVQATTQHATPPNEA